MTASRLRPHRAVGRASSKTHPQTRYPTVSRYKKEYSMHAHRLRMDQPSVAPPAQPLALSVPRQSVINEAVEQISHALQTDMQLYSGALQGAQFGSSSPSCAPAKSTKAVQKEPAVTDVRPSVQALQLWECRRSH